MGGRVQEWVDSRVLVLRGCLLLLPIERGALSWSLLPLWLLQPRTTILTGVVGCGGTLYKGGVLIHYFSNPDRPLSCWLKQDQKEIIAVLEGRDRLESCRHSKIPGCPWAGWSLAPDGRRWVLRSEITVRRRLSATREDLLRAVISIFWRFYHLFSNG